ncbi:hypothetical protein GCM10010329_79550 [Streptomyces spiroverticillatus]|uniref:Uncharacterized protein n=1 Tax=Streptomyces finlayi TaxID=67296 RepID=A0A918X9N0_9ACTN|nr:hypothetical protein GCM10010329_79550 [Streptomyces spiroverticillatus]GHD18092.1 hypothetical protein GCM10010334_80530 [Streptomyces finlayi]
MDDDAADVVCAVGISADEVEEGGAEILKDAPEAGSWMGGHRDEHASYRRRRDAAPRSSYGPKSYAEFVAYDRAAFGGGRGRPRTGIPSVESVTASRASASGATPMPGPVGTGRCPSARAR